MKRVSEPYRSEVVGGKGSVFYRAHSYHTKVPPEGIVRMIEHYTNPGDVVVDPFCGSGMTGVACVPVRTDRGAVRPLPRRRPHRFRVRRSRRHLRVPRRRAGPTRRACHARAGAVRHPVCPLCGRCAHRIHGVVRLAGLSVLRTPDPVLGRRQATGRHAVEDVALPAVCKHVPQAGGDAPGRRAGAGVGVLFALPSPRSAPTDQTRTHRRPAGTPVRHRGLVPDRAVRELAGDVAGSTPEPRNPHCRRLLHGSQPVRARRGVAPRQRVAPAQHAALRRDGSRQPGLPALPVESQAAHERPVRHALRRVAHLRVQRVLAVAAQARRRHAALVAALADAPGACTVAQSSAAALHHLDSGTVDYVFTDPPFGANIYYSDASFLWESWLDDFTPTADEAVVSTSLPAEHGAKTLQDYEKLMATSFSEVARVLKPRAWASVMFHNSDDAVWSALERALESADLHSNPRSRSTRPNPASRASSRSPTTNGCRASTSSCTCGPRRAASAETRPVPRHFRGSRSWRPSPRT